MDYIGMSQILLVDDESLNIDYLSRLLTPRHEVSIAKTGREAIDMAKKNLPDLILINLMIPDINGFEVITALKESDLTRKIPIMFITDCEGGEKEEKALLLGAADYIVKPFNDCIIKARVRTHLQIVEYISTIEKTCKVDAMTSVANRSSFNDRLQVEWIRASNENKPLGLLIIDIDDFRRYNEVYGHTQGDFLLKSVAVLLEKSLFRPADVVARWGGEEFVVLLPETGINGAVEVAERLRALVERLSVKCAGGTNTNVTVSVGVNSELPHCCKKIEDFVHDAEIALKKAKSSGRNCVITVQNSDLHRRFRDSVFKHNKEA